MRNEIFRQINQNKVQYYSELKSQIEEEIISRESLHNKMVNEASGKKNFRFSVLKMFRTTSNKHLARVILIIHNQISDLLGRTRLYLSNINNKLSKEAKIRSNRLTEGLTQISSQLFEDRYEYQQQNKNSIEKYQISYDTVQTLEVCHRLNDDSVQAQFVYWLNKLYIRIILFLESDEWFEKIDRSQKVSSQQNQRQQLKDRMLNSCQRITKPLNRSMIFKYIKIAGFKVKEKSSSAAINEPDLVKERINFVFFRSQFKNLSKILFPTVNRFI